MLTPQFSVRSIKFLAARSKSAALMGPAPVGGQRFQSPPSPPFPSDLRGSRVAGRRACFLNLRACVCICICLFFKKIIKKCFETIWVFKRHPINDTSERSSMVSHTEPFQSMGWWGIAKRIEYNLGLFVGKIARWYGSSCRDKLEE